MDAGLDERRMKLEALYDRYGERLFHFLSIKLGSRSDAEDVLQDVFLRFSKYEVRWAVVRNVDAFVFRVARNEANRFLRRRLDCNPPPEARSLLAGTIDASIVGPDNMAKGIVAGALAGLPDEQREVIVLKVFEELTFKEIASVCGVSINTAASRYRYGITKLQSLLDGKL